MTRKTRFLAVLPAVLMLACSGGDPATSSGTAATSEPTAESVLVDVATALGTTGVDGIVLSGSAWRIRNSFRQTPNASPPWPYRDEITSYMHAVDFNRPASRATGDTFASNLFLEPPVAGRHIVNVTPGDTAWGRQLEYWLTPWGFLAGATANGATLTMQTIDGIPYRVLSWRSPATQTSPSGTRYTVNGYVDPDDRIARVETWVEDAFMGDMHVVNVYSDYRDFSGVMVPTTIEQHRGGGAIFGVSVNAATANPSDLEALLSVPDGEGGGGFGGGGGQAPADIVTELAPGVWLITGGYVSLVAEFSDHLLVFESGQSEARGEQILSEAKRLVPDKPIRYIVNSHPHSDHTAGLIPFIREGVTLVTHSNNVDFLNMALSTPRTLLGETTLMPEIEGVDGVGVYADATMRVELHHIPNLHSDGMLVAVLPAQGILLQADFTLPPDGAAPNPFVRSLAEYVAENDVQFERYLAVHAAAVPQTRADLLATIGQ